MLIMCRLWKWALAKGSPPHADNQAARDLYGAPDRACRNPPDYEGCPEMWKGVMDERFWRWYLRRLFGALIRTNARLSVNLLESLSHCTRLVVLALAGRKERAYSAAKTDGGATMGCSNTGQCSVRPDILVARA